MSSEEAIGSLLPWIEHSGCIYLDYNGTTPIFPEVATAMLPFLAECFGNPSSDHIFGRKCKQAVDASRAHVAALINCDSNEVFFTSSGTESDNCERPANTMLSFSGHSDLREDPYPFVSSSGAIIGCVMAARYRKAAAGSHHFVPHVVTR